MRQPLDKALRKKLEETVIKARDIVEAAVKESLQRLGVAESQAPSYLKDNEKYCEINYVHTLASLVIAYQMVNKK